MINYVLTFDKEDIDRATATLQLAHDLTVQEKPDLVILTGDIFETKQPVLDAVQFAEMMEKTGVYWMRFLEKNGFCGILADEMGLGKTLQTLTWLSLARCNEATRKAPALVIAPTSLVENWRREAEKFTPGRKCVVMQGAARHELWDEMGGADIVITSYALLRRDLEHYAG